MYEYHGWITLLASPKDLDEEEIILWEMSQEINELLLPLNKEHGVAHLESINGNHMISLFGHFNHANSVEPLLLDILKKLAAKAPGSYGLLYIRDDENMDGLDNEFQVWKLVRGEVKACKDQYLSPCIPIVEDPFE